MNRRIVLQLRMTLLSDAIFGAGFSVPGGEDISVYTDGEGWPFFKATSLKGLLRESTANLLAWTGRGGDELKRLFGTEDWEGLDDGSRVYLGDLVLTDRPAESGECFARRSFTAIENGIVREGSLREAVCIRSGLVFEGMLSCREEDADLLVEALGLVKWVGTSRSRGFGRVRISAAPCAAAETQRRVGEARCLRYVLHTELPVIITRLSASGGNGYESRSYIPGSVLRGMAASALAQSDPVWFEENKEALLGEGTRFLNALPMALGRSGIPSLMGFYEDKAETKFESVVKDGSFSPGSKRARVGTVCAPEGDTLYYWSAETDGYTRIQRPHSGKTVRGMFQTRHIAAGQDFVGYILLDRPALADRIAASFGEEIWIGADRYEGFGRCRVLSLEAVDAPDYLRFGFPDGESVGSELYMALLSPLCMPDETGEPGGLQCAALAEALGVGHAEIVRCSSSVSEYGAYNRRWGCREGAVRMYDAGSLFKLRFDRAPALDALRRIEREGLGLRRAEGYGQVLFLRTALYEGLCRKQALVRESSAGKTAAASLRREKLRWIMEHAATVSGSKLSPSQCGTLQEKIRAELSGDTKNGVLAYLDGQAQRNARSELSYRPVRELIETVLSDPLAKTLDLPTAPDDRREKLRLLDQLFDYSRK